MNSKLLKFFATASDADLEKFEKANAWNTADAPDSAFAYVPASAKGPNGKKSGRKFPLCDKTTHQRSEAIVRNAIARFTQASLPAASKAGVKGKICSAARAFGIQSELCGTKKCMKRKLPVEVAKALLDFAVSMKSDLGKLYVNAKDAGPGINPEWATSKPEQLKDREPPSNQPKARTATSTTSAPTSTAQSGPRPARKDNSKKKVKSKAKAQAQA